MGERGKKPELGVILSNDEVDEISRFFEIFFGGIDLIEENSQIITERFNRFASIIENRHYLSPEKKTLIKEKMKEKISFKTIEPKIIVKENAGDIKNTEEKSEKKYKITASKFLKGLCEKIGKEIKPADIIASIDKVVYGNYHFHISANDLKFNEEIKEDIATNVWGTGPQYTYYATFTTKTGIAKVKCITTVREYTREDSQGNRTLRFAPHTVIF